VAVVTADEGVAQVQVEDAGLELAGVMTGDAPAEDQGQLVGLADGAVGT
jgi:hypothetical protein